MAQPLSVMNDLAVASDRQSTQRRQQVAIDGLVVLNSFGERHIDYLLVRYTHHHVALIVKKGIDGSRAQTRGEYTVARCRRTHVYTTTTPPEECE